MSRVTLVACAAMFGAPFVLLALRYGAMPPQIVVLRGPIAGGVLRAQKSLFTVFRVPLMNLIHGAIAAVMLSCSSSFQDARRRDAYSRVFLTLAFAVALKSDFEALELSGLASPFGGAAAWLTRGTIASIAVGVALALVFAHAVPLPWPELRLRTVRKWGLVASFAAYLGVLVGTFLIAHRA